MVPPATQISRKTAKKDEVMKSAMAPQQQQQPEMRSRKVLATDKEQQLRSKSLQQPTRKVASSTAKKMAAESPATGTSTIIKTDITHMPMAVEYLRQMEKNNSRSWRLEARIAAAKELQREQELAMAAEAEIKEKESVNVKKQDKQQPKIMPPKIVPPNVLAADEQQRKKQQLRSKSMPPARKTASTAKKMAAESPAIESNAAAAAAMSPTTKLTTAAAADLIQHKIEQIHQRELNNRRMEALAAADEHLNTVDVASNPRVGAWAQLKSCPIEDNRQRRNKRTGGKNIFDIDSYSAPSDNAAKSGGPKSVKSNDNTGGGGGDANIEGKENEMERGGGGGQQQPQQQQQKSHQTSALKSAIHRQRVQAHQYRAPQRTVQELYMNADNIQAGPDFDRINADEDKIDIKSGDGTGKKLLLKNFSKLIPSLKQNIEAKGYQEPTLIQKAVIPIVVVKKDYDLVAQAQTGTGKTGAFLFPIIHVLEKGMAAGQLKNTNFVPHAIIIAPTRELAQQLGDAAKMFTHGTSLNVVCTYGEIRVFETLAEMDGKGCDILVTTMGRLTQFVNEQKIMLTNLSFLVLDEADKLLREEAQFREIRSVHEQASQNAHPLQTLLFSATIDYEIMESAAEFLRPDFFVISVASLERLPVTVKQQFVKATDGQKIKILCNDILATLKGTIFKDTNGVTWQRLKKKVVIFCNSRRRTNWLALKLSLRRWRAIPTSGGRSQMQRQQAVEQFLRGDYDVLVSTSIIARGLNLSGLGIIINYEMPKSFDEFVHRTGRTGRAGNRGRAISFINPDQFAVDLHLVPIIIAEMEKTGMEVPESLRQIHEEEAGIVMNHH